jgi:branched-chain amino acid transport system ATP-binding protein
MNQESEKHTWEKEVMLSLKNMSCGYGNLIVVENLSFHIARGSIFALIGANGAGKSSTIMAIAGHVSIKSGTVSFNNRNITQVAVQHRVRLGIALAPEGRRLFSDMTVNDNLAMGCYSLPRKRFSFNRDKVFELFPRLKERKEQKAASLSGGEQQMLAIGRALMAEPELLIIDELSLGLMPKIIDLCYRAIAFLKDQGVTILLVEQNTSRALDIADHICVLESGRNVWQGSAVSAKNDPVLVSAYLGLTNT